MCVDTQTDASSSHPLACELSPPDRLKGRSDPRLRNRLGVVWTGNSESRAPQHSEEGCKNSEEKKKIREILN